MKLLITLLVFVFGLQAHADLPDLTGNYTGCGVHSASGKQQMVLVLVRMPAGLEDGATKYSGGFYLKTTSAHVAVDFFSDVRIHEPTQRILMLAEITPARDFGKIVKTLDAKINPDGSITGTLLTNATGSDGRFQSSQFTVKKVEGLIQQMNCK